MNRQELLQEELALKTELRTALNKSDASAEQAVRAKLEKVRTQIGSRTLEEAYGAMAY